MNDAGVKALSTGRVEEFGDEREEICKCYYRLQKDIPDDIVNDSNVV